MVDSTIAKLFGGCIELKMHEWAKKSESTSYAQARFHKHHSTIDHLNVTLRLQIEESRLEGKGLYYCFVKFKKVISLSSLEKYGEHYALSEYMLLNSRFMRKQFFVLFYDPIMGSRESAREQNAAVMLALRFSLHCSV